MIPMLYDKQFKGAGTYFRIGPLPAWIECSVTEELNGEFFLEGTFPLGALNADQLAIDRIIMAAPSPVRRDVESGDPFAPKYNPIQPFRIRRLSKSADGSEIHVTAHHVSYQLTENIIRPISASFASAQQMFNFYFSGASGYVTPEIDSFLFLSDIVLPAAKQIEHSDPVSVRAFLGGDENSIQSLFGGEFDWDGWRVMLRDEYGSSPRGRNLDITVAYGKNMVTLEYDIDAAGLITGYYGYWKKDSTYKSHVLYKPNHSDFAYARIAPVDLSGVFETVPTDAELDAALQDYMDAQHDNELPTSITVTAVPEDMQQVFLCDRLTIIHPGYQMMQVAKIVRTVYDPIRERYTAVTIGEIQKGITDTIARMLARGDLNELNNYQL